MQIGYICLQLKTYQFNFLSIIVCLGNHIWLEGNCAGEVVGGNLPPQTDCSHIDQWKFASIR